MAKTINDVKADKQLIRCALEDLILFTQEALVAVEHDSDPAAIDKILDVVHGLERASGRSPETNL